MHIETYFISFHSRAEQHIIGRMYEISLYHAQNSSDEIKRFGNASANIKTFFFFSKAELTAKSETHCNEKKDDRRICFESLGKNLLKSEPKISLRYENVKRCQVTG